MKSLATNKNIIGLDVSLDVCEAEGYMLMDTEGDKSLNPNKQYHLFSYYPEYTGSHGLRIDVRYSWNEAKERYMHYKEGIDSFSDDMPKRMRSVIPTFYDLLSAIDTISGYCGVN